MNFTSKITEEQTRILQINMEIIIRDIEKSIPKINHKTKINIPHTGEQVPIMMYIYLFYQAITNLNNTNLYYNVFNPSFTYKPVRYRSLIELIYFITNSNMNCTGKIEYQYSTGPLGSFFKKDTKLLFHVKDIEKIYTKEYKNFVNEFISRVKNSDCALNSIAYGITGNFPKGNKSHATILLTYYDKSKDKIYISLYDPAGSDRDVDLKSISDQFISDLINVAPEGQFIVMPDTLLSCPIGIQTFAGKITKKGFCVMFSLFWLYCVLKLDKMIGGRRGGIPFAYISNVEAAILATVKTQGKMKNIISKFAVHVINEYIRATTMGGNAEFNQRLSYYVKSLYLYIVKSKGKFSTFRNIMIKNAAFDIFKIFYSDPSLLTGDISNFKKQAREESNKKQDGEKCDDENDCLSHVCHENKCISFEQDSILRKQEEEEQKKNYEKKSAQYSGPKHPDGVKCDEDFECMSGICQNNICTNIDNYIPPPTPMFIE